MVLLWGSNARETHPIYFHHLLKGVRNGARLYAIDPRRTSSARWADAWLGLEVGSDIALANAVGREIIAAGLTNEEFVREATEGFEAYRQCVEPYTLEHAERITGVPADAIRDMAHTYGRAKRAIICWTLGVTEHHDAVDTVLALSNLALLTGHVGRYGSGLNPLRGQNNVQGGGDMGALPDRLPGFQHVESDALRERVEKVWGHPVPPRRGWNLSQMFEAMERRELRALYVLGENPLRSEADATHARNLIEELDFIVVQDLFMTATAEVADVVLPAAAAWCESEGTVTNSERRVQRVRRAIPPPGGARDDLEILFSVAKRLGHDWGTPDARRVWDELRQVSPVHAGMSWARLEADGGLQWPCYDEAHPGELFLHSRLWERPIRGLRAPFSVVRHSPPIEGLDADYPLRLTTGRRLEEYNTGVQTSAYSWPRRTGETLDVSRADGERYGLREGEVVRVRSRRGSVEVPVRFDEGLRPGLVFMTLHFPDDVETNLLTIDATDPKSGTAEFKAAAVRIERLGVS